MPLCSICGNARGWNSFSEIQKRAARAKRVCLGCENMFEKLSNKEHILEDISTGSHLIYQRKFYDSEEADDLTERLFEELPWDWTFYEIKGEQVTLLGSWFFYVMHVEHCMNSSRYTKHPHYYCGECEVKKSSHHRFGAD